jgi:hypothetical protein
MRIESIDNFKPNKMVRVDIEQIISSNMIIVDRFLTYLSKHMKSLTNDFISQLILKYKSLSSFKTQKENLYFNEKTLEKLELLQKYPQLIESIVSLICTILEVENSENMSGSEMFSTQEQLSRAWLITRIYFSELLTKLMDRDEAIKFLKEYFVYYANNYRTVEPHDNLLSVFESDLEGAKTNENTSMVSVLINNEVYASRVDKCIAPVALQKYTDAEIKYTVCCSADYAIVKKTNENFVLTRTITLMNGPYCDFCCHDTRYTNKIEHPSMQFYEKLGEDEN